MGIVDQIRLDMKEFMETKKKEVLSKAQKLAFESEIAKRLKQESGVCAKCPRTESLTLDHIVPSIVLRDFGIDIEREIIEDNYQILCRICNQFKSGRLDFSNPKTKEILIRLLNNL